MDVGGSRDPNGPVADPPCGVGVREVRGIDYRSHGRVIPTAGANKSCGRQKDTALSLSSATGLTFQPVTTNSSELLNVIQFRTLFLV